MMRIFTSRRRVIALFASSILPLIAACGLATTTQADEPRLDYLAECSESEPGEAILRLQWAASATSSDTRIEVTIYKDGFQSRRFVSVSAAEPQAYQKGGATFSALDSKSQGYEASAEALNLDLKALTLDERTKRVEGVVGGLIPGINYFVRVSGVSDEIVRVRAPICPVDSANPTQGRPQ